MKAQNNSGIQSIESAGEMEETVRQKTISQCRESKKSKIQNQQQHRPRHYINSTTLDDSHTPKINGVPFMKKGGGERCHQRSGPLLHREIFTWEVNTQEFFA